MKIFLLTLILSITSCSHTASTDRSYQVGKDLKTYQYGTLFFSKQPTRDDYKSLKDEGFSVVINLRNHSEYNEKEEIDALKKNKIEYFNIPFPSDGALTTEYISAVTKVVGENKAKGKILIHCSSGNRVGIWLGGHFYKDHKFSKEKSMEIAKELGLNNYVAEKRLRNYLISN